MTVIVIMIVMMTVMVIERRTEASATKNPTLILRSAP